MSKQYDVDEMKKYCIICRKVYGKLMRECCTKNSLVCINFHGFFKRKIKYFSLSGTELSKNDLLEIFKREELIFNKLIENRKKRSPKNSNYIDLDHKNHKNKKLEIVKQNKRINENKFEQELINLKTTHLNIFQLIQDFNNKNINDTMVIDELINATNKISKNEYPFIWAYLQSIIGTLFAHKHGDRVKNQENAIAAYNKALEIRNYNVTPYEWALTLNNLSIIYSERILGNKIENIEKSINCCQEALRVLTRDKYPQDWSQVMNNLGKAYCSRIKGVREENIEKSINAYKSALEEVTKNTLPIVWSQIIHNLGLAFYLVRDFEKAKNYYDRALEVRTYKKHPILWAESMHCRALAYLKSNDNKNLKEVIDILQDVLKIRTKESMPIEWSETKYVLALAQLKSISTKTKYLSKENLFNFEKELKQFESDDGNTLLMYAANQGFSSIVEIILNTDKEAVHIENNEGSTALICACQSGQIECVKQLLKANANPNVQNKFGFTPLTAAIFFNDIEIVKLLINFGSDINLSNLEVTPLNLAILQDNTQIATLLINNDCNINKTNKMEVSPLFLAIHRKYTDVAILLIVKGADLNVQNSKGSTPLMEAIYLNSIDIIHKLIDYGSNLDIQDNIGYTALMIATDMNNIDIVKYLIRNNADINITDRLGNTALLNASMKGHINCAKILIKNNAKIDIENDAGNSAIEILLQRGDFNINELSKTLNLLPQKKSQDNDMNNKSITNSTQIERHLRIFISSTFIDMDEERNLLVKNILPQLREYCEKNSIYLTYVDLRWGITEEQSRNEETLSICLEEIEKCNVFIGMLGDRYGWVPEFITAELLMKEEWLKNHEGESITEIEFWKGAFNNSTNRDVFFYLRDSSYCNNKKKSMFKEKALEIDIEHFGKNKADSLAQDKNDKLYKLKNRIIESPFINKNYLTPNQFATAVLDDIKQLIIYKYPIERSPLFIEREKFIHSAYALNLTENYVGRDDYFRELISHCDEVKTPLVIIGEYGSGKSALLANWLFNYHNLIKHDLCIPYFAKANNLSNEINVMLKRIITELNNFFLLQLDLINSNTKNYCEIFIDAINYVSRKGKSVVIVIDDVDRITHNHEKFNLSWIPVEIPKNIQFVVSTSSIEQAKELNSRSWDILKLKSLNTVEKFKCINNYFKQFGKTLSDNLVEQLANSNISNQTLNLQIVLYELTIYSNNETLKQKVSEFCKSKSTSEILDKIFSRYESDYKFDISEAMKYIASSRFGLDELELRTLIGDNGNPLPQIYWIPFFNISKFLFSNTSGLIINFSNEFFRIYIEKRYMGTDNTKIQSHTSLSEYFQHSTNPDRKILELPWQLLKSCSWSKLYDLLSDISFFSELLTSRYSDSFMYWHYLEKNGYSPSVAYKKIFEHPNNLSTEYLWIFSNFFIEYGLSNRAEPLINLLIEELRKNNEWKQLQLFLTSMIKILSLKGDLKKALNIIEEKIKICNNNDNMEIHLGRAFVQKADILYKYGKIEETLHFYKKASELYKNLSIQKEYIKCEHYINTLTKDKYNLFRFINKFEHKLRDSNNTYDLLSFLCIKATALQNIGDFDQSISIANEGLKKTSELALMSLKQDFLLILSLGIKNRAIQRKQSNYYQYNESKFFMELLEALSKAKKQEKICKKMGDIENLNKAIGNQGIILKHLKEYKKALNCLLIQEKICHEYGFKMSLERCYLNIANVYYDLNEYAKAEKFYKEGEKLCREINLPYILFSNLFNQVQFFLGYQNYTKAYSLATEAYQLAIDSNLESEINFSQHISALKGFIYNKS